ncbi:MAG TPA: HD domain-containing phosphohydrolase [Gemmatimonadaceae bacterium]|nr:HD domain-containing phosphohydrolase [Gemmatimonadaceae bacterium]
MGSALTEEIESLVHSSAGPSAPELKVALSRLSSEIKQRLDKGSPTSYEFVSTAIKALSRIKGGMHAEARMACLWDSGVFLFSNKYDREALDCARSLLALARQVDSKVWVRKAYTLQGAAFSHMGDPAEALLHYSTAMELAREARDYEAESSILNNLGTTLNYAGLYREAIPCLNQASDLAQSHEQAAPYLTGVLCNLAQSYLYLGESEKGFKCITECLVRSEEPRDAYSAFSRVVREFTFVQLALELGKLGAAREHSGYCFEFAQRSGTKRAQFIAVVCRAMCQIHGGDVRQALDALEKALENSGEAGSAEHVDALKALVKAYDHASLPEDALRMLRQLLNSIRDSRQKSIGALLSISGGIDSGFSVVSENIDLQDLSHREARLRVQVAEREVVNSRFEMLERLAVTSDLKEEQSGEHGYRVGRLSALVGSELGWTKADCFALDLASRLHDIGKIAVPDRILLTSQELKEAERHFISAHTVIGAELLAKSNIPQLRLAEEIARCHHEWWNGEGYPSKLAGKRIPIHARIVALADVFDALTHGRPFAQPWTMDRAVAEIETRRGTQFDPELTDLFIALVQRLRNEHVNLDEYLGRAGRNSPFLQARNKIRLMLAEERENEKTATVTGNETRH